MSGGTFERELKGILRGDTEVLRRITRSCSPEERESYWRIEERPFTVLRAAGSLGRDLVAIRGDISFPIEVKASKRSTLWLSKSQRTIAQAKELIEECSRSQVLPLYAFRLKNSRGDSWRVFTVGGIQVAGVLERVQRDLPKVTVSKGGHYILRWSEGWPLHRFIEYIADGLQRPTPKR
jgi:Holliday junction resolvase